MIKYKSVKQEKCEPRYRYDCYIGEKYLNTQFIQSNRFFLNFRYFYYVDLIETPVTMQMRICNKVPKRDCEDPEGGHIVCETNYETG